MIGDRRSIYNFGRNLVVQAGAGTGKTYNLVGLFVCLLAGLTDRRERVDPAQIVAVTFTDKAAAEMRERVRERVHHLCEKPDFDPDLNLLAREQGVALPSREHWEQVRTGLDSTFIGTFHSYCGRLLRTYALAAGLDPDFGILTEEETGELLQRVIREVVLEDLATAGISRPWLELLPLDDSERRRGLTGTLATLLGQLRELGDSPDLLLEGSPYTPEGASQLITSTRVLVEAGLRGLVSWGGDLKPATRKKLVELGTWWQEHRLALANAEVHHDQVMEWRETVKQILSRSEAAIHDARDGLFEHFEAWAAACATREAIPLAEALRELLVRVNTRFHREKELHFVLDFSDLILRARNLLREHPDLRRRVKRQITAVLVDEFQDTNRVQKELVYLLAEDRHNEVVSSHSHQALKLRLQPRTLFVVGDRKQSIYAFRGADVAVFGQTLKELSSGHLAGENPGRPLALQQNRRSVPGLIAFTNHLFRRVMSGGVEKFEVNFEDQLDELGMFRPDPGTGAAVDLLRLDTRASRSSERVEWEARVVAGRISQLLNGVGPHVHHRDSEGVEVARPPRPGDVVILLRRFQYLDLFVRELILRRIPHRVVRGQGFYQSQEVRDLVGALRLLISPTAGLALLGVLRSPLVGLSDESVAWLSLSRRGKLSLPTLLKAPLQPGEGPLTPVEFTRLQAFLDLYRRLRPQVEHLGASGVMTVLVEMTHFDLALLTTFQGEQKLSNVNKLKGMARDFDQSGRGGVATFVRSMVQKIEEEPRETPGTLVADGADVVQVMTIHQAKGLEFPLVVLPECGASSTRPHVGEVLYDPDLGLAIRLPKTLERPEGARTGIYTRVEERHKARELAESRRLFYVAVTRARDHLFLVGEATYRDSWRKWLDEILPELEQQGLLTVTDATRVVETSRTDEIPPEPMPLVPSAAELAQLCAPLSPSSVRPSQLVVPVTQLDDFHLCPRRYYLWHELSVEETPAYRGNRGTTAPVDGEAHLDALQRGTLAHNLLEQVDLSTPAEDLSQQLSGLLSSAGLGMDDPQVALIHDDTLALLLSPFGEVLRQKGEVAQRELPFTLPVLAGEGFTLFLSGQIDLLIPEVDGVVRVVDYKTTHQRNRTAADYHFQLMAYALAARRIMGVHQVRAEILFLKERGHPWEGGAAVMSPDDAALNLFEQQLATLARVFMDSRLTRSWDKIEPSRCRDIGCGYFKRCWKLTPE